MSKEENQLSRIVPLAQETIKRVYSRLVGIALLKVALLMLLSIIVHIFIFNKFTDLSLLAGEIANLEMISIPSIFAILIGVFILLIETVLLSLAEAVAIVTVITKDVSFKKSVKIGITKWCKIIAPVFLAGLLVVGVTFVAIVPALLGIIISQTALGPAGTFLTV